MNESASKSKSKYQDLIPATRDTVVHFLFASPGNEHIMLDFLNAVLESDNQPLAASVEIENPFNPQTFLKEKRTILDIKATDKQGYIFMVEFQTSDETAFADRFTYYGSRTFGGQLLMGNPYSALKTVVAIAVTNFLMFPTLEDIHNVFLLTSKADPKVVLTNLLQMHVLETTKEKIDQISRLPSALQAWTNFFYYSHFKSEEEMSTLLQDHPPVKEAYEKYRQFNSDKELRALDEAHQKFLHDQATKVEIARKEEKKESRIVAIFLLLSDRFDGITEELEEKVQRIIDIEKLNQLIKFAAKCENLSEFEKALD